MKSEKPAAYYDAHFENEVGFQLHYKQSFYYVHWTQVMVFLKKIGNPEILEIGCGTGQLAAYLKDENFTRYAGFDFSPRAITLAKERVPDMVFSEADALNPNSYRTAFNTVICLEVLEHIQNDLQVLANLPTGTNIIFSIPNFDAPSHVRWFTSERQIKKRYFRYVDIKEIIRIGNIYVCRGVISVFKPDLMQMVLATRERINIQSFTKRISHRLKNVFKISTLK